MKISLHEAREIAEVTGLTEEQVRQVIHYLNMTDDQRTEAARLAQSREDHDL